MQELFEPSVPTVNRAGSSEPEKRSVPLPKAITEFLLPVLAGTVDSKIEAFSKKLNTTTLCILSWNFMFCISGQILCFS